MKEYTNCPICSGSDFKLHLEVTDHMITKQQFKIDCCQSCGFHFTNPIPSDDKIGDYYKSDSYISHSSSKKGFINKVYNTVRNITLKRKVKLIQRLSVGKELLDIGAGTAHFLNEAKNSGFKTQGLEPDDDAKRFAKEEFNILLDPLSQITEIKSSSKDIITMWHVLEHVYHLQRDMTQFTRVLKHDGVFLIAVPNMSSYDAKHYQEYWAAYDVPRHLYHFQENSIRALMSQFNMECIEVLPMKFDSYYVSMLSEKYKGGNMLTGILNGLKSNLNAKKGGFSSQIYVFQKKEAI